MSDARPIGIFDSGVGGLTVVHEIFRSLPNEAIIYFGDTARVPYGTKSPKVVETFALQDILFLLEKNVKLVIAACHTVSSVALDRIVQMFHFPILGVVEPGVAAALEATRNSRIGVIGTRATVVSGTYEKKILAKRKGANVFSQACPLFVPLAEEGWLDGEVTQRVAELYLAPLIKENIDTLILGCTHYPLLKHVLKEILPKDVVIIDSAEETAKLVANRLRLLRMTNHPGNKPEHTFYVTDIPYQFQEVGERFLATPLKSLERVDLESLHLPVYGKSCGIEG
jgi:glutamate racemase